MARYIDAEPLEAEQYKGFNRVSETDWQKGYWSGIDEMCDKIKEQPTADVAEVVHAFWEEVRTDYICSHCNTSFSDELLYIKYPYDLPKYCPDCDPWDI